jgi:hypothetical protein
MLVKAHLPTLSEAEVTRLIDALDPLTLDDPPPKWRAPLEKLRAALMSATRLERICRAAGPTIAVVAFFIFEWSRLTPYAIGLLSTAGVSSIATALAPLPRMRVAAAGLLGGAGALLHLILPLQNYVAVALLISAAISLALEHRYPVLDEHDRIRALIRYFEPNTEPANVPSRLF